MGGGVGFCCLTESFIDSSFIQCDGVYTEDIATECVRTNDVRFLVTEIQSRVLSRAKRTAELRQIEEKFRFTPKPPKKGLDFHFIRSDMVVKTAECGEGKMTVTLTLSHSPRDASTVVLTLPTDYPHPYAAPLFQSAAAPARPQFVPAMQVPYPSPVAATLQDNCPSSHFLEPRSERSGDNGGVGRPHRLLHRVSLKCKWDSLIENLSKTLLYFFKK